MESAKIKNLVIAVLILLNLFFLVFVVVRYVYSVNEREDIYSDVKEILRQNGIALDIKELPENPGLTRYVAGRNPEAEAAIAQAVLGETTKDSLVGNVDTYSGKNGKATFQSSGLFEIKLNSGTIMETDGAVSTVKRLLSAMKISTDEPVYTGPAGGETVTANCVYKGATIYDCKITFGFSGASLIYINGRRIANLSADTTTAKMMSAATAILKFSATVSEGKNTASAIFSVSAGYRIAVTDQGDYSVNPVWLIRTENREYLVDTVSGAVSLYT